MFEEDIFEEEISDGMDSENIDDETQYALHLINKGLSMFEDARECITILHNINIALGESITGLPNALFDNLKAVYTSMLPDLILSNNEESLINSTKKVLGVNEEVARGFLDQKRLDLLKSVNNYKK